LSFSEGIPFTLFLTCLLAFLRLTFNALGVFASPRSLEQAVNLESNAIDEKGMLALAAAVVETSSLKEIRLTHQSKSIATAALELFVVSAEKALLLDESTDPRAASTSSPL
jgi:hypothetical protein